MKSAIWLPLLALLAAGGRARQPPHLGPLADEMRRLEVREALLLPSQAIAGEIVWSPRSDFLAVRAEGKWVKVDLRRLFLEPGTWRRGRPMGLNTASSSVSIIGEGEVRRWSRETPPDPRRVATKDGTSIELRADDAGTSLVVTPKGQPPDLRWTADLETCHGLALSPDERLVAFVYDRMGVMVESL